jgi:hypothetical protein
MRITKKVVQIGNAIGVIIDKPITKKMKIKLGDLLEIIIRKIE